MHSYFSLSTLKTFFHLPCIVWSSLEDLLLGLKYYLFINDDGLSFFSMPLLKSTLFCLCCFPSHPEMYHEWISFSLSFSFFLPFLSYPDWYLWWLLYLCVHTLNDSGKLSFWVLPLCHFFLELTQIHVTVSNIF